MKVWNLRCAGGHGFEGWFGSEQDFVDQQQNGLLSCPMCGDAQVERLPSAPRLNLSGAKPPKPSRAVTEKTQPLPEATPEASGGGMAQQQLTISPEGLAALQTAWMGMVQQVLSKTEDVGERFPEEARRMHYGETESRSIRGQATAEQRAELSDEGIEVLALPVPEGLAGPRH
ncbi:DUF1178 family protein [Ideonella azotifigens]|nr:DUF1178 family protein [Ideonella azotifigens]MCD2344278.1 DUF1178 family protein [Ideonella azotifigens]